MCGSLVLAVAPLGIFPALLETYDNFLAQLTFTILFFPCQFYALKYAWRLYLITFGEYDSKQD
jgi:hypothetical protein